MPKHSAKKPRRRARVRLTAALMTVGVSLAGYVTLGDKGLTSADAAGRLLMVSTHADRSGASEIANSTISGTVYVFVRAVPGTSRIVFYVDSSKTPVSTEDRAPFDLAKTAPDGTARPWDVSRLGPGSHSIHYTMTFGDRTVTNNATFTVAGRAPAPARAATPGSPAPAPTPTRPARPPTTATPTRTSRPVPAGGRTARGPRRVRAHRARQCLPRARRGGVHGHERLGRQPRQPERTRPLAEPRAGPGGRRRDGGGARRDLPRRVHAGRPARRGHQALHPAGVPHQQVWFDGTDVVGPSRFTRRRRTLVHHVEHADVLHGQRLHPGPTQPSRTPQNDQCAYADSALDPANPMANDPPDGVRGRERAARGRSPGPGGRDELRVHAGPGVSHRAPVPRLRPGRSLPGGDRPSLGPGGPGSGHEDPRDRLPAVRLQHHRAADDGSGVQRAGPGLVLENDAFVRNAGPAFSGSLQRGVVRHSLFVGNGANGITSNGHFRGGGADDTVIETSLFSGNNAEHFDVHCSASCTVRNIKLNHMVGFTVRDSIVQGTSGHAAGIWCDLACTRGVIVRNTVSGNGGDGIVYEVSDTGIIASNLVTDNGGRGMVIASANTKVYNNTLAGQLVPFNIYDDSRSFGVDSITDVGPDTRGLEIVNNVVQGSGNMINCGPPMRAGKNQAPNTGCRDFFTRLDYNTYAPSAGVASFQFADLGDSRTTTYRSLDAFRAAYHVEAHSEATVATANLAGAARAAIGAPALPLPADVAAAVGVARPASPGVSSPLPAADPAAAPAQLARTDRMPATMTPWAPSASSRRAWSAPSAM